MRRAQKRQAEDFLKVLEEAHEEIRAAIENRNYLGALGLLEDCQQGAITLGEMIEAAEGEGCAVILLLEKYCELVYQCHEKIMQGETGNGNKVYKLLRSYLRKIESSIKNDIKERTEAVFLPYKASMWDSLESVWKAADEDPDCDAYVIPIPYYDRKSDGSFGKMHYEGDQYPEYVPVTWYRDYDIEGRKPDMIFIHNPYDNTNFVTSVHPDFYSERLKQLTEKLIYIPYFILDEIEPDDQRAIGKMAHFCTCPGVLNADKVVVQSEGMRQIYINILTENTKEYGYTRKDWEDKILGFGSPKVDKVLNTKKECFKIPKDWLEVIEKPDGTWKKIIFYNTSVSALLQHDEKMLEKMKSVFGIFEENKDEVALLWRPHPLIKATIESMRPQLWAEYERIVEEYKEAGWGIYDDTADMDRAVVISDGYYGDVSSVVSLCRRVGSKAMIQRTDIDGRNDNGDLLCFEAFVRIDESTAYAASDEFNALFRVDIATGNCTYVRMFPNEKVGGKRLYTTAVLCNSEIYFVPCSADKIAVYNIVSEDFTMLEVKGVDSKKYPFYRSQRKFNGGILYESWIYIISCTYPGIIRIDIKTKKIEYFDEWISGEYMFRKSPYVDKNQFYIPSVINNFVLRFNMDTCEGKVYSVGKENCGCWSMCRLENDLWMAPKKVGPIIRWNPENNHVTQYYGYPKTFKGSDFMFTKIYVRQGKVYLLPACANMCLKVSPKDGSVFDSGILQLARGAVVYFLFEDRSAYYLKIVYGNKREFIRLDTKNNQTNKYSFRFTNNMESFYRDYLETVGNDGRLIREREYYGLRQFLCLDKKLMKNKSAIALFTDEDIGAEIFRKTKCDEW